MLKSLQGRTIPRKTLFLGPPRRLALVDLGSKKLPPEWMVDRVRMSLLGDNYVVEVAGHFLLTFFAICSVPYTECLLYTWHLGPAVECVTAACVSLFRGRGGRWLNIHGITIAGIGDSRVGGIG